MLYNGKIIVNFNRNRTIIGFSIYCDAKWFWILFSGHYSKFESHLPVQYESSANMNANYITTLKKLLHLQIFSPNSMHFCHLSGRSSMLVLKKSWSVLQPSFAQTLLLRSCLHVFMAATHTKVRGVHFDYSMAIQLGRFPSPFYGAYPSPIAFCAAWRYRGVELRFGSR